jgi:solute:Na+ symporter, SSS family
MEATSHIGFTGLDWIIVVSVLVGTTLLASRLAKTQRNMHDFFLGGKQLPWYAVSASIVATEISTVTFISLPFVVFREGGNLTYLQLGLIGSFIARCIVGYVLVPAYYKQSEANEVYSPYDYMGQRLGEGVRRLMTLMFTIGGILGQAARVYLTALVLEIILYREFGIIADAWGIEPMLLSMCIIGSVSILWTLLGGIATVVWTDALLFLLFIVGVVVTLVTLHTHIGGGLPEAFAQGAEAGKFVFWDFDTSPTKAYTFWTALFAVTWSGVGSYGTDQMLAQRLLCCRSERDARKAIILSIFGLGITLAVALIGIGLWSYYSEFPLTGEAARLVAEKGDRIYPIFISDVIPDGLRGLVLAGAFAAAVSSMDSILAALSQTTLSGLLLPARRARLAQQGQPFDSAVEDRFAIRTSRRLIVFWGITLILCALGIEAAAAHYDSILDLALAMATYTAGGLLAGFFLALLNRPETAKGLYWSAPLSMLSVFAIVWHTPGAIHVSYGILACAIVLWSVLRLREAFRQSTLRNELVPTASFLLLCALIALVATHGYSLRRDGRIMVLAWPWYVPIGSIVAFFGAMALTPKEPSPASNGSNGPP